MCKCVCVLKGACVPVSMCVVLMSVFNHALTVIARAWYNNKQVIEWEMHICTTEPGHPSCSPACVKIVYTVWSHHPQQTDTFGASLVKVKCGDQQQEEAGTDQEIVE